MGRKKNEIYKEDFMQSIVMHDLIEIVRQEKERKHHPLYIRTVLKEYLQVYILNFVYTHPPYMNRFIFTGGTALRHVYELPRLSEDIDFDLTESVDLELMIGELKSYWAKIAADLGVIVSVHQRGKQVLHRFSVLHELGLTGASESPVLHVKSDLSPLSSKFNEVTKTFQNRYGFAYLLTHYDQATLMANKIHAVLYRERYGGEKGVEVVKGRDFFDLLWFLRKKVEPNWARINELLGREVSKSELWEMVDERVKWAMKLSDSFARDLEPFIDNQEVIKDYVESYEKNYLNYKAEMV
jgi:predicted nucleotidyltransferase component of viral defense system